MPQSDTGERVTEVLDFPSRDGLWVQAIRVDYEPIVLKAGESFYEPPNALHSVSRNASEDGLWVQAIRVDYEPGGFTPATHRHPAGAYVYVIDGSVKFA